MEGHYEERFHLQQDLIQKAASLTEVNQIIEMARETLRIRIPNAMEVCVILIDPDARSYTRPLQCALYETPVDCQSCKRNRTAVQKAIEQKKAVVIHESQPVKRPDNSLVAVGSEAAVPVFVQDRVLAAVSVVIQPLTRFSRLDFFLIKDVANIIGSFILTAKRQWETTREKIRISRVLTSLSPFVPESVRHMADKDPKLLSREKQKKEITVLFLDIEGYTALSASHADTEVNAIIEKMFSSFVDPIHRSSGDINETAGDGLMILFKDHDPKTNAMNSVKAAFEIMEQNKIINRSRPSNIPPIEVNIGINSGSALVGMTRLRGALKTRMTFTASGRVTNVAARLSDLANGGDILLGKETQKMVDELWPVHDRGLVQLKGLTDPLQIFSLLKPG